MKIHELKKLLTLENTSFVVTIVGLPLLLISLWFAYQLDARNSKLLEETVKIASSQNNILLNTMIFNDSANKEIISAIDNGGFILTKHGGYYNNTQLDKYLGDFDTVDFAYKEGLLTEDELCDSFSDYVMNAISNKEINKYLSDNPNYFPGIVNLHKIFITSNNQYCR